MLRTVMAPVLARGRRLALLPLVGGLILALGAPAGALAQDPKFTCRASALRIQTFAPLPAQTIEPFVANGAAGAACPTTPATAGFANEQALPNGLGQASVVFARAGMENGASTAEAGVLDAMINAPAPIGAIGIEVLTSEASARCMPNGDKDFAGSSEIAAITIAGQPIRPLGNSHQEFEIVPVAGAPTILVIHFAEQTETADQITQQALKVEAFNPVDDTKLAEVVIGEAIADLHGACPCPPGQERVNGKCVPKCPEGQIRNAQGECVCPPGTVLQGTKCVRPPTPPAKCNAGSGNGSEPVKPTDCDPGGSGGKNRGGD